MFKPKPKLLSPNLLEAFAPALALLIVHRHRSNSGSLAMFAAIRLASSRVSSLAAERRSGSCGAEVLPSAHYKMSRSSP